MIIYDSLKKKKKNNSFFILKIKFFKNPPSSILGSILANTKKNICEIFRGITRHLGPLGQRRKLSPLGK